MSYPMMLKTLDKDIKELKNNVEFQLLRRCAPTLANLKTAGLFAVSYKKQEELEEELRRLDEELREKNVRLMLLRARRGRALVYCCRPCRLKREMEEEATCRFLEDYGYCPRDLGRALATLARKLNREEAFPHEIGIFLGYPLCDVTGFICHKGQDYKCCADWKVYENEEETAALFRRYRECRAEYIQRWLNGESLARLTLAEQAV